MGKGHIEEVEVTINNITMIVKEKDNRIVVKPITDLPNMQNYSFSMNMNSTAVCLMDKLNAISKVIKEMQEDKDNYRE